MEGKQQRGSEDLARRIRAFIAAHHVLSLATHGPEGPHAANVFYAHDGMLVFWVSDRATRHSREIEREPRVAITIAPDYADFPEVRGLQMSGTARRVESAQERARLLSQLEARYPFLKRLADLPQELREAYARVDVYRFEPTRAVLIDNTRGFGHRETLELGGRPPQAEDT
jgi:uncharacterized protein YhbP (UPF0306 family)